MVADLPSTPSVVKENLITAEIEAKVKKCLMAFETGSGTPQYDSVTILTDGKVNSNGFFDSDGEIYIKQFTGFFLQTTEQYNLKHLLQMYIDADGIYSDDIRPYMKNMGIVPLEKQGLLNQFSILMKKLGNDRKFQEIQHIFFDKYYYFPAVNFFKSNGFTLPLSLLVVFDSTIQSGRVADFLRSRFSETPPAQGGREKYWIQDYLRVRKDWMMSHKNAAIRRSVYRVNTLLEQVKSENWMLEHPFKSNGVEIV